MAKFAAGIVDTGFKFATGGVGDTGDATWLDLWIASQIFENIWNNPEVIFRGLGEDDS